MQFKVGDTSPLPKKLQAKFQEKNYFLGHEYQQLLKVKLRFVQESFSSLVKKVLQKFSFLTNISRYILCAVYIMSARCTFTLQLNVKYQFYHIKRL
jgi:hypothetical protein